MKTYWVYMLQCFDGSFCVGVTSDLDRRYNEHCLGIIEGCYTHTRRPLQLVYAGEFNSIRDAIDFEKRMKRWTHRKKRVFAQKKWADLKNFSVGRERPERKPKQEGCTLSTPTAGVGEANAR